MKRDLEIICLYRSNEGRETNYNLIKLGEDVMDIEDYEANNFWQTMGGLSITIDGYKNIFHSTNFYNAIKPVNFLLESLYSIEMIKCDWFDLDEGYQNNVLVKTSGNETLKLSLLEDKTVSLSYIPFNESLINKRGKHYFEKEFVNTETWVKEAETALEEYFTTLAKVIRTSPINNTSKTMKEYLDVYTSICSKR